MHATYLEDPLVLLAVRMLDLLRRRNVVLEVSNSVLPRLESLSKQPGDLGDV